MEQLQAHSLDSLNACAEAYDACVDATVGIDAFCSSSLWSFPAAGHLSEDRTPYVWRTPAGFVAWMERVWEDGSVILEPLESAWWFASPLLGADAKALSRDAVALLEQHPRWDAALIPGLQWGAPVLRNVAARLQHKGYVLYRGPSTVRYVASLDQGVEGFLGRRSANFRHSLSGALRKAEALGVQCVHVQPAVSEVDAVFKRVYAVECASWKGLLGNGIVSEPMAGFYRAMAQRLAVHGAWHVWFAVHEGQDVGYLMGAVGRGGFRALQCSFDEKYRKVGLGNVLQRCAVWYACEQGLSVYDLGSEVSYKERWAEGRHETVMLVVRRPSSDHDSV
jgi:hypothetical protein